MEAGNHLYLGDSDKFNWKYCANDKVLFNLFYYLNESDKPSLLRLSVLQLQWEDMQNVLLLRFGVRFMPEISDFYLI